MSISTNELRDFLRHEPPRTIPPAVRKKTLKRVPSILLFFGLFFGLFGLLSLLLFFPWHIADDLALNAKAQTTTTATITARTETSARENNVRVFQYTFSYTTDDGIPRTGACYHTGGSLAAGSNVTVEYLPDNPSVARIKGCRVSMSGLGAFFVILFPLVGFGLLFFTLRARKRLLFLLSHGRFSSGRIESIEATNIRVNNQTRFRVRVSFHDGQAHRTTCYHAYGDQVSLAESKRDSNATVGVLYNPSNPNHVLLVDELLA